MLDELKFRYRSLKLRWRILILCVAGTLPAALTYFEKSSVLESELESAKALEATERQKLATASDQAKNLPAMEEKKSFTSDQLKKAEKILPAEVLVDNVLEQVGKSAKSTGVDVRFFAPAGEKTITGEYSYDEVRFKVTVGGKFHAIAKWLDAMGGVESRGYVKTWDFSTVAANEVQSANSMGDGKDPANLNTQATDSEKTKNLVEIAKQKREQLKLELKSEIVFYRTATNISVAPPAGNLPGQSPGNPGAAPAAGAAPANSDPAAKPQSPSTPAPHQGAFIPEREKARRNEILISQLRVNSVIWRSLVGRVNA